MVVRAWGTVNGEDIIFTRESDTGDVWTVDVPKSGDGEYVTDIYAEDEAGNVGYLATMLFIVSGHEFKIRIISPEYCADILAPSITTQEESNKKYQAYYLEECVYRTLVDGKNGYKVYPQEGGYSVERVICCKCAD